jgi:50S ribosomal subunit-associated GTPase HflX
VDKILLDLELNNIPRLVVLNKADLLDEISLEALERQLWLDKQAESVAISAIQSQTLKPLVEKIGEIVKVSSPKSQVPSQAVTLDARLGN